VERPDQKPGETAPIRVVLAADSVLLREGIASLLENKGFVRHEYDGPRYVYFPSARPEEASRSALKQLVRTFFDNSPGSAMAALFDITETPLSEAEHRRLTALLKRVREHGDKR